MSVHSDTSASAPVGGRGSGRTAAGRFTTALLLFVAGAALVFALGVASGVTFDPVGPIAPGVVSTPTPTPSVVPVPPASGGPGG